MQHHICSITYRIGVETNLNFILMEFWLINVINLNLSIAEFENLEFFKWLGI